MKRVFIALILVLAPWLAMAQDEQALIRLWSAHTTQPSNHADMAKACAGYLQGAATDGFAPLVRVLAAWHLLKQDQTAEAAALLEPCLADSADAARKAGAELARAWLTRLDRERVRAALQFYYRKEVGYPIGLALLAHFPSLPADLKPPDRDRWGSPWHYQLVGFKKLPGLQNQKYELLSTRLAAASDLAGALARPFGESLGALKATRVRTAVVAGREVVEFTRGGETIQLTAGTESQGLLLAHVGAQGLILCDASYWIMLPRPPGP